MLRSIVEGIKNDKGALVRVVGASQDITDQVRARDRLEESEQRLKSAQQLAQIGSWYRDLEADRVSCSEQCVRIFGHPEDYQPSLEKLIAMITPRDRDRVAGEINASLTERRGLSTEFRIARTNAKVRIVTFSLRVSLNEEGVPRHVFGACQDITDLRTIRDVAMRGSKIVRELMIYAGKQREALTLVDIS